MSKNEWNDQPDYAEEDFAGGGWGEQPKTPETSMFPPQGASQPETPKQQFPETAYAPPAYQQPAQPYPQNQYQQPMQAAPVYQQQGGSKTWLVVLLTVLVLLAAAAVGYYVLQNNKGDDVQATDQDPVTVVTTVPPDNSAEATQTTTSKKKEQRPARPNLPSSVEAVSQGAKSGRQSGNLDNVWKSGPTSDVFAMAVAKAFSDEYRSTKNTSPTLQVYSAVTGQTYQMTCSDNGQYVHCTGGNNANVYIA